jgi:hypothetical protein
MVENLDCCNFPTSNASWWGKQEMIKKKKMVGGMVQTSKKWEEKRKKEEGFSSFGFNFSWGIRQKRGNRKRECLQENRAEKGHQFWIDNVEQ